MNYVKYQGKYYELEATTAGYHWWIDDGKWGIKYIRNEELQELFIIE